MEDLGQSLRSERLKQGLTLQDVAERTSISVAMLQLLEEGNFEQVGTPLLIRSFIKKYCAALEIDPSSLLEKHNAVIVASDRQQEGIQRYKRLSTSFQTQSKTRVVVFFLFVFALVGALSAGVWIAKERARQSLTQSMTRDINSQQELPSDLSQGTEPTPGMVTRNGPAPDGQADAQSSSASETPMKSGAAPGTETTAAVGQDSSGTAAGTEATAPARETTPFTDTVREQPLSAEASQTPVPPATTAVQAASSAEPRAEEESTMSPQDRKHRLIAEADQKVWVQVKVDNQKTYDILMQPGQRREWEADEGMSVVVGNAGGVRMHWDGKPLKSLGKPGQVVRFRLPDSKYLQEQ